MSTITVMPETPVTVRLIDKATGAEIHTEVVSAESLGGTYTRLCYCWNARIDGGVRWRNPTTGDYYPGGISIRAEVAHPDTGDVVEIDLR